MGLFLFCSFFISFFHFTFSIFLMTYAFSVLPLWSHLIRDFLCQLLICPQSDTEKSSFSGKLGISLSCGSCKAGVAPEQVQRKLGIERGQVYRIGTQVQGRQGMGCGINT